MISRFHVQNFRSIVDLDLSLSYDEGKAPTGYKTMDTHPFLQDKTGRYVPCLALYGANASGKSNIVRAFKCLQDLLKKDVKNCFMPNRLHPELKQTVFHISFSLSKSDVLFEYLIAYDSKSIHQEFFKSNDNFLFSISQGQSPSFTGLVNESFTQEDLLKIYQAECCSADDNLQFVSFFGKVWDKYPGLNKAMIEASRYLLSRTLVSLDNGFPPGFGLKMIEKLAANKKELLWQRFIETIRTLDFGIDDIKHRIEKKNSLDEIISMAPEDFPCSFSQAKGEDWYEADMIHTYHRDLNGNQIRFNLRDESEGTIVLFGLLGIVLTALETGLTIVVDEIDRSLHPLILKEVVRMFKSRKLNRHHAQLIFTTHTTDLLDTSLLRVSEVGIVNKTLKKGTTVNRLSQFSNVRNVTNFRRRYLEGEFRGIPHPYVRETWGEDHE